MVYFADMLMLSVWKSTCLNSYLTASIYLKIVSGLTWRRRARPITGFDPLNFPMSSQLQFWSLLTAYLAYFNLLARVAPY